MKLILRGLSFCLHSIQSTGFWPSSLSFLVWLCVLKFRLKMLLSSGVTQVLWLVSNINHGHANKVLLSYEFPVQLRSCRRDVKLHMSSKVHQKGGTKRGKRVHWVIYRVSGNTLVLAGLRLRVQLEIHIRGLRVWSMSRWITTAGEVSWQTGPGHWIVLETSLRYYINRIKMSVQGLLASFERSEGRIEKTWTSFKMFSRWWENSNWGVQRGFSQSWSWIWFFKSIIQAQK